MMHGHIEHTLYTRYTLRNMIDMLKSFEDRDCKLYAVALNIISILAEDGSITHDEECKLYGIASDVHTRTLGYTPLRFDDEA